MRIAVIGYMQIVEQGDTLTTERRALGGGDSGAISQSMAMPGLGAPAITPGTIDLRTTLPISKLERHIEWYLQNGFQCVTLDEMAEGKVVEPKPGDAAQLIAPRRLAITFDGGFESHYRLVFPLLQKHNLRATFFIPRDMLDKPGGLHRGELEIMAKWGMGLGILVPAPEMILRMLPPAVASEIAVPRRDLEQIVGRPIFLAASQGRHVEGPFLRTLRVHDYKAIAISEIANHQMKENTLVIGRYFHRKNVKVDEWKEVAKLSATSPAKNSFYLRPA